MSKLTIALAPSFKELETILNQLISTKNIGRSQLINLVETQDWVSIETIRQNLSTSLSGIDAAKFLMELFASSNGVDLTPLMNWHQESSACSSLIPFKSNLKIVTDCPVLERVVSFTVSSFERDNITNVGKNIAYIRILMYTTYLVSKSIIA